MRKLLIALFALGMIFAFTAPAYATDASFSGTYRVRGWLESNHALTPDTAGGEVQQDWYDQRLRLVGVLQVAEGLKLTTRADIMEKMWGATQTTATGATALGKDDAHTHTIATNNENISWERAYVTFMMGGKWDVGYQSAGTAGTSFQDSEYSAPRIKWTGVFGNSIVLALLQKGVEQDGVLGSTTTDNDYDAYALAFIQKFGGSQQVGIIWFGLYNKTGHDDANPSKSITHYFPVWYKGTFGPLYIEAEGSWYTGKNTEYYNAGNTDIDQQGYGAYVHAKYNMGPAYVGAQIGWVSGDDPNTADKNEQGWHSKGNADWCPLLILMSDDLYTYQGNHSGNSATVGDSGYGGLTNGYIAQIFGGYSPMENLSLWTGLAYAKADEKPLNYVDDEYGTEFDITATYKIYDNLEYMVGFGYLWTGDYFKGTDANNKVEDDYLLMHKLQLTF